jgi:hypothetical protein
VVGGVLVAAGAVALAIVLRKPEAAKHALVVDPNGVGFAFGGPF